MDLKKLKKLKRKIGELWNRSANIRHRELASIAKAAGRKMIDRGKEPTFESEILLDSKAITIPDHPGSLSKFTAESILESLEKEVDELIEILEKKEKGLKNGKENGKRLS